MAKIWQLNDTGMPKVNAFLGNFLKGFSTLWGENKANVLLDVFENVELKACNFESGDSCVVFELRAIQSTTGKTETLYLYPDDFEAWEVEA